MKLTARLIEREGKMKLERLVKVLKVGSGAELHVGVLDNSPREDSPDGMTNVKLAAIQEFGAPKANIPARPFIRGSMEKNMPKYKNVVVPKIMKGILEGRFSVAEALEILGNIVSTDMKNFVTQGPPIPPPNTPAVAARKQAKGRGKIRTLIDTGRMVASITYAVVFGK